MNREKHSEAFCAMYEICGKRSDGKVLNCPNSVPSVKVHAMAHNLADRGQELTLENLY